MDLRFGWQLRLLGLRGFNGLSYLLLPVAGWSCSYLSPKASIAEHEELYHYLMTENHREGRYTDFNTEIAASQDTEYRLRPLR